MKLYKEQDKKQFQDFLKFGILNQSKTCLNYFDISELRIS